MLKSPARIGVPLKLRTKRQASSDSKRRCSISASSHRAIGRPEQRLPIENGLQSLLRAEQMDAAKIDRPARPLERCSGACPCAANVPATANYGPFPDGPRDSATQPQKSATWQTCHPAGQRMRTSPQQPCKATMSGVVSSISLSSVALSRHFPFTLQVSTRSEGPSAGGQPCPGDAESHHRAKNHDCRPAQHPEQTPPEQRRRRHEHRQRQGTKPTRAKHDHGGKPPAVAGKPQQQPHHQTAATYNHVQTATALDGQRRRGGCTAWRSSKTSGRITKPRPGSEDLDRRLVQYVRRASNCSRHAQG